MSARLMDLPPRDFRRLLDRAERETRARLTDHGTAAAFVLRGAPPATYEAEPLFELETPPERGPEPLRGQTALDL
jgi:hypothetical protein